MDSEDFRPSRRAVLGVFARTLRGCGGAGLRGGAGFPSRRGRRPPGAHVQPADRRIDRHRSTSPTAATSPRRCSEISYFMRDWRENQVMKYDARNVDNLAATLGLMDTDEPYLMISGYRTPQTNSDAEGRGQPLLPPAGDGRRRPAARAAASSRSRAPPSPATAAGSASTTARTSCTWTAGRSEPGAADVEYRLSDYPPTVALYRDQPEGRLPASSLPFAFSGARQVQADP